MATTTTRTTQASRTTDSKAVAKDQKIVPHLWYDKEAKEAAHFYASIFPQSRVTRVQTLRNTPGGDSDIVSFELAGHRFMAISAGPLFKFNPSVSFMLNYDPSRDPEARKHLDEAWKKLSAGGQVLMPLDEYPFSEHYGWVQDKYGLSWQLILTNPEGEPRPFIIPSLLFVGPVAGRAEDAIELWTSVFKNSRRGTEARHGKGGPDKEGTLLFADFMLEGQWFAAMDSADPAHKFAFNEAVSLLVQCDSQQEIDNYWSKLSAVPEAEQCGWLKDEFGVSWQIAPRRLGDMLAHGTREQVDRVTQAFLPMKKFDVATLERAYAPR